jgi:hypothetical protein
MTKRSATRGPSSLQARTSADLGAYRAERAHSLPEPPMTDDHLYDAMVHLAEVT